MIKDQERTEKLEELRKIKAEIDDLLVEKAQIVKDINIPIYKAKSEAEAILVSAKDEADTIKSAADKILKDAQDKHAQATELLHTAKGGMEELRNNEAKLSEAKIAFDADKFAHEALLREKRNVINNQELEIRAGSENLQQSLIDVKQREDSVARKEKELSAKEAKIVETKASLEAQRSAQEEVVKQLEKLQSEIDKKNDVVNEQKKIVEAIHKETETISENNKKLLQEVVERKSDLTRQQNDLARQIEILDNSKAEVEEKVKSMKEQTRLMELKMRQNDEKIATLNQLRNEK